MLLILMLSTLLGQVNPNVLRDSLPQLDGEAVLAELSRPVVVERDAQGVPTVRAHSQVDAVRAQGFVHAQDRLFQMDGLRRLAAGELAALGGGGPAMLSMDQRYRPLRFRHAANELLEKLPAEHRQLLVAYAQGVNAAIAAASSFPPEYAVLQARPEPWSAADCLLVMYVMFDMLHFDARFEAQHGMAADLLAEDVWSFLTPLVTRFDAPLIGPDFPAGYEPEIPGPDVVNLRTQAPSSFSIEIADLFATGSNNWAVASHRSKEARAILANDPHLHIAVPNIWYRVRLQWQDQTLTGISLPGVPGIIAGSNGKVAWGVTNTMGDFQDLIVIEVDPNDPSRYRVGENYEPFEVISERIEVRGQPPVELKLMKTRWGVVTERDWQDRPLVLKWTALDPEMVNLNILNIWNATNVEQALEIGRSWWGPSQNLLVADDQGSIGWIVTGYLPRRIGFDGKSPVSWADGTARWDGALPETSRPMLINPASGVLYTANNRSVEPERASQIGKLYDIGCRASRIREMLQENPQHTERDLLQMQLDTRSQVHDFYRDLVLEITAQTAQDDEIARQARSLAEGWNGTADADQVGYRLVRLYRRALHEALLSALLAPVHQRNPQFTLFWLTQEEPLRAILRARPQHLLPQPYESWDEFLRERLDSAIARMSSETAGVGPDSPWGHVNRASISHPLAMVVPALGPMLNMPADPMSGDQFTVRVATKLFSASMRMVVSPGHEEQGFFHMPCGQSGHPLSPHYRDGHEAWINGSPTPFLPGVPVHTLMLKPGT